MDSVTYVLLGGAIGRAVEGDGNQWERLVAWRLAAAPVPLERGYTGFWVTWRMGWGSCAPAGANDFRGGWVPTAASALADLPWAKSCCPCRGVHPFGRKRGWGLRGRAEG